MPWKEAEDPYAIWLSEIILQQTRVEQGRPYYERFLAAYPTVEELAAAPDDEVMKQWEGLGYYSRARNLLRAARMVVKEYSGNFPNTYSGLQTLPGIGPYTAAAIASFAFDRQVPVLDGNVFRILARYTGEAKPIDSGKGKKHFQELAAAALGPASAKRFNQAIMDFGALVCTPRAADCRNCPLAKKCVARLEGKVYELPVKEKKIRRRSRFFHYLVVVDAKERYLIHRRDETDIWALLYEFPLLETTSSDDRLADLVIRDDWPKWLPPNRLERLRRSKIYRHVLTHQSIELAFYTLRVDAALDVPTQYRWVDRATLSDFALPRVLNRFLTDRALTLDF